MVTKTTRRKQRNRPTGITTLAILEFIGAIFGILGGIGLLVLGGASVVSGRNVVSGGNVVSGRVLLILGVVVLVIGVVDLVLGYGYWTLQSWARPLGIGLQILGLVVEVISIVRSAFVSAFVGSQCLSIFISVIVLLYLTGPEVRHAFDREPQPPGYPPSGSPPNAPAPYGGYAPSSGYGQAGGYGPYAPPSYPMGPGYPPSGYPPSGYPPSGYPPQPSQGTYPQQGVYPPPPHDGYSQPFAPLTQQETGGGFAIAGLILGIISIPIAFFAICGYITAILGIIFSMLGRWAPAKRTMATIGVVLSVLGFLASIGSSIVGVMLMQHQYPFTASNAPTPSYSYTTPVTFPSPTRSGPAATATAQVATATALAQTGATGTLSISGSAGDPITQGKSYSYATSKGDVLTISASSTGSRVEIRVTSYNGDWWTLDFQAPGTVAPINGKPAVLVPGTYSDAHGLPFSGNGPILDLEGNSRGCNTLTGSFTIIDAVFGPYGYVQKFDATFVQHCEGLTPAASGEVHLSKPPAG